jgi:hypothetical protein
MQVLERFRSISSACCRLTQRLAQHVGQFRRFAVFHRVYKDSATGSFTGDVDALQPSPRISPCSLTVADHQKLIDSRQREKL